MMQGKCGMSARHDLAICGSVAKESSVRPHHARLSRLFNLAGWQLIQVLGVGAPSEPSRTFASVLSIAEARVQEKALVPGAA